MKIKKQLATTLRQLKSLKKEELFKHASLLSNNLPITYELI